MDGGAWWAGVHGVAKSRTRLSDFTFNFMHWRRKWQPTPVVLPGESQGQRSLVGCRLWGRTELDMTAPSRPPSVSWAKLRAKWVGRICCVKARWGWWGVFFFFFFIFWGYRGGEVRGRGAGNRVIKAGGGTPPSPTYTHTPQPTTPSALQEKAWIRKDGGEQRAFARRRCYLIVCVTGGAAVERMLWSFPPGAPPPPRLSPLSVSQKIKSDTVSTVSPSISHEVMGPDAMIFVF